MNKLKPVGPMVIIMAATFCVGDVLADDLRAMETHMQEVRNKAKQKRDSAIGVMLDMTAEQAENFRPLVQEYDKELSKLGKRERGFVREFSERFGKLTSESAEAIGQKFFDLQRERLELQQNYLKQISDGVSPVIAVQFIQLQRQFETEVAMERMKYSPLAE
jgi:hypothetical protein